MIFFPPAKINLGLFIESKRSDGYHDLLTAFYQIGLRDVLEILPWHEDVLKFTGLAIDSDPDNNLVTRARDLIRKAVNKNLPPLYIHLHKIIPMGAGLGGGSSDAAYTLMGINQVLNLNIDHSDLLEMATSLGADCPLFLSNQAQVGQGKGEILKPIDITELSGKWLIVLCPDIHISTREAFSMVRPRPVHLDFRKRISELDLGEWKTFLINDFEGSLFPKYPLLSTLKERLMQAGALYASMTGSGSAMYGLYKDEPKLSKEQFPDEFFWKEQLK
jgi:4-diphosphocytidyl-2-C-methyl-D-erythritol kinase